MPINEVTEFIGITLREPGNWETRSLSSMMIPPAIIVPGIRMPWSDVLKSILAIWGTAMPIKPIGPQKAVTLPARMLVPGNITQRAPLILRPLLPA